MMGRQAKGRQLKMFYPGLSLERRVRPNHPLRQVKQLVDFDFIYHQVAPSYGVNGNVSVPPPVILKWMLLLVFYNVRSERELMATLPERLDWLWFIGFDLDDEIPDHSVLSKARSRWGTAAFKHFFDRIVCQCVAAGLVDGSKIFMDSSLVQADASNNSIIDLNSLKSRLNRHYQELEARLAELPADWKGKGKLNKTHLSTTDPDASLVSKGKVRSQLSFKVHRAVDDKAEVITATAVTSGAVHEGHHETFQYQDKAKVCRACPLRDQCTDAKRGRTLRRHLRHDEVQLMRERALSFGSKKDIRTRQHLMERSFARAVRFGFKRARWRRLWRVQIQEYLTAAIQNIMILVRDVKEPGKAISLAINKIKDKWLNLQETYLTIITSKGYFPWVGCF